MTRVPLIVACGFLIFANLFSTELDYSGPTVQMSDRFS